MSLATSAIRYPAPAAALAQRAAQEGEALLADSVQQMLERFEGVLAQQAVALEGLYADNSHLREALEQNRVAALAKEGALQGRIDALELQLQAEKRDAAHQIRTLQATLNAVHHSAQKALDTVGRQHPHSSPGSIIKHHLASLESIKVELETILANVSTNFTIVS